MTDVWRQSPKKPYKPRDSKTTSAMMSRVKNRDSKAELALRKALWNRNWRYRLHSKKLIGKPDLVFNKQRVVIFVDGDFWHGRALQEEGVDGLRRGLRTKRSGWWLDKIQKTVERDQFVTERLRNQGWLVLRFWESEIHNNLDSILENIEKSLSR